MIEFEQLIEQFPGSINGQVIRRLLLTSVIGIGNYETRIVADALKRTLLAGVHGYAYAISAIYFTEGAYCR